METTDKNDDESTGTEEIQPRIDVSLFPMYRIEHSNLSLNLMPKVKPFHSILKQNYYLVKDMV